MWKKLTIGAALIVVLSTVTVVGYVRAVIGSYRVEVLDHDLVIGRGEFTVTLTRFDLSWQGCTLIYYARGVLQAEPALRELIAGSGGAQWSAGVPIPLYEYHTAWNGRVEMQLSTGGGASQTHVLKIADIRGREAEGVFGFLSHDDHGAFGYLCRCRVTRR